MNKEEKNPPVSVENIYRLNGRVPLQKAIPFGLQHVLAMFVSNLAPVLIVCSAAIVRSTGEHLTSAEITRLLQCAMFAAGIGTCMQLYPIWKIGSRLPIVMGGSFTFLGSLLVTMTGVINRFTIFTGALILILASPFPPLGAFFNSLPQAVLGGCTADLRKLLCSLSSGGRRCV